MERRAFVKSGLQMAATLAISPKGWAANSCGALAAGADPVADKVASPSAGLTLPRQFLGLGYEMSSVARLGLLSTGNRRYVNLLRNLGPNGVLRFGGIVADYTSYVRDGKPATDPKRTVVTRAALEQLRAFLDLTGWTAIWSVNFGQGTLEEAIVEAREVAAVLGERLAYLELGNEVDNYGRGAAPLRTPPYTYREYRAEYVRWHTALAAKVPGLRFAAPDTAESVDWLEEMARDGQGIVQLLTTHYYRNAEQDGNADQLAHPDPNLSIRLRRLQSISASSGIPWRMCETNSFSGGGLPGVSDTLLGALWTFDYLLLLAANGCSGVNLETGVNQLGFISSYSPVQDDGHGTNSAGAPYYGLLALATLVRESPAGLTLHPAGTSLGTPVYRFSSEGAPCAAVVVNRDPDRELAVPVPVLLLSEGRVLRLGGERSLSGRGISFGGAPVRPDGSWSAATTERLQGDILHVPPSSAALVLGGEAPARGPAVQG